MKYVLVFSHLFCCILVGHIWHWGFISISPPCVPALGAGSGLIAVPVFWRKHAFSASNLEVLSINSVAFTAYRAFVAVSDFIDWLDLSSSPWLTVVTAAMLLRESRPFPEYSWRISCFTFSSKSLSDFFAWDAAPFSNPASSPASHTILSSVRCHFLASFQSPSFPG